MSDKTSETIGSINGANDLLSKATEDLGRMWESGEIRIKREILEQLQERIGTIKSNSAIIEEGIKHFLEIAK